MKLFGQASLRAHGIIRAFLLVCIHISYDLIPANEGVLLKGLRRISQVMYVYLYIYIHIAYMG